MLTIALSLAPVALVTLLAVLLPDAPHRPGNPPPRRYGRRDVYRR